MEKDTQNSSSKTSAIKNDADQSKTLDFYSEQSNSVVENSNKQYSLNRNTESESASKQSEDVSILSTPDFSEEVKIALKEKERLEKIKEKIAPISWLIGSWSSISAKGQYPTMNPFEFYDELEFNFVGQSYLLYSRRATDLPYNKKLLHVESGFVRIIANTNKVAFNSAQSSGLCIIEEGDILENVLTVENKDITQISGSFYKVKVVKMQRTYTVNNNNLEVVMFLETDRTPLCEHLRVVYRKNCDC